ncbi:MULTISPECIES: AMP-binding protein [Butyricimonas]|uniref:AMP-binding protein n=1 Tax=Butyricimonas TaxID=574697 RepID=UPI001D063CBA|nr:MULTISPECIES: AMP-binding protein [Butyricimonas]MCB6972860.1 AMP-binding protein [Butyricimonas synergistica]MCG4518396.1 AMP-binding protein [Butyricimonas sp. DFI.6.44]
MTIKINGIRYTTPEALQAIDNPDVVTFLQEWYDDKDHVTGHTSGSTGTPKTIRLSKQDMLASAKITNAYFDIHSESRLLLCLSPSYIAGKMMIVRSILAGADLIVVPPSSSPLKNLEQDIDFAAMVPMQVETCLATPETAEKFSRIKQVIIGGAALSPVLEERLQQVPTRCYSTYGMTETVSHVALRDINGVKKSPDYFALGNVHFETDERQCLIIHAPHLHQQTFTTNDIVNLVDTTRFEWLGRHDNVINSGGIKLFPEKIEAKIALLMKQRFFIMPEEDTRLGQRTVLVIEDIPWDKAGKKRLQEQLKQLLHPYEVPKKIYFREHFTETYSGKVIRKLM